MKWKKQAQVFLVVVVLLVALAVYQMILIFWEMPKGSSGSSFKRGVQPDTEANLLKPSQLYITLGGAEEGNYSRIQEQETFQKLFGEAYDLVRQVIGQQRMEPVAREELPWQREACVLAYDFTIESRVILDQLEVTEDWRVPEGRWTEIWVLPALSRDESAQVYFLNFQENQFGRATSKGWTWAENQAVLETMLEEGTSLTKEYLATANAWPFQFESESYLLEEMQRETAYQVTAASAFIQEGEMAREFMTNYALRFFEYPDTVSLKESETTLLFTNEKMTVKMDKAGRLQFVETLTDEEKQKMSMRQAYQLAAGFLREDLRRSENANYEVAFAGYEIHEEQYVFYFNYIIGGIPYRMEPVKSVEWRMEFPIKITIEGTKVRRYERYVLNIAVQADSAYSLRSTWLDAANRLTQKDWSLKTAPRLAYYLSGNHLNLQWEAEAEEGRAWTAAQ